MKTPNHVLEQKVAAVENRSFRRWAKQLFASWMKHQGCHCQAEMEKISEQLQEIETLIEVVACEIARQGKRLEGMNRRGSSDEQGNHNEPANLK